MANLAVHAVHKRYGAVRALSGVALAVPSGQLSAVLGPSGCGKTTLLRCVAGFERVDAGEIEVGGRLVASAGRQLPPERRRVAVVPQEGALFPHLSVGDNVAYGLGRAARRAGRVHEVLELVGLAGYADRMPHELSGGQQQRVAVARALAPRPPLVLLDEPFSALDAGLRADLRRDVRQALQADGATAVLVTHDQGEALSMADQVAVMRDGVIVQSGTPAAIYGRPTDAWVADFVGEAVLLPATVAAGVARTVLGELALTGATSLDQRDGAATVLIRPEQVAVLADARSGQVAATVTRRDFFGHDALLSLRLDEGEIEVAARVFDRSGHALAPGERVGVTVRGPVLAYREQPAGVG
ncbi:ABC transporter ATP-binding protein [Natronosporangium hydrolyticum]|uniref:ABC-type quaternary amine transporter n=1 Tax=Natronosporangium hydrolyticum TaxID=2811111 RepID=A0A895YMN8_9ACTN|nr:ABC transporter ATP-binding protein [Natronosporangium hydrolyticum]QSB15956.1 ABC transporter ATP-binding protein [Natronosporangium hydrolyticum]